ncbi:MAG TPA: lipase, partial [Limnobacter sp.]|nr:lipase [Limnobacter sp.]
MNELSPTQIFDLSETAYLTKNSHPIGFSDLVKAKLPFVERTSVRLITATSGLGFHASSAFGFMAKLNGGRSTEIVIATRGTLSTADVGTDLN